MPKSEMHVNMEDVTLQPNPVEEMAVELRLDVLDFCLEQLEDDCAVTMSDMEIDENELEVSKDSCNVRIKLTANSWEQIAECNANHALTNHPDAVADSKTTQAEPTAVKTAPEWLEIDEEEGLTSMDIFTIVNRCLKDLKKLKCGHTVKMMTQLMAVSEYLYAKLRDHYRAHGRSKKPCLNASLAIAH